MKRVFAASSISDKFWDLHESGYDTGIALEEIIKNLGYTDDFFPDDPDNEEPAATDEQYAEVLRIYEEDGNSTSVPMSEEELVSEIIRAVSRIDGISYVESFDEAGMMTKNYGFVVHDESGNDFQFELLGSWH